MYAYRVNVLHTTDCDRMVVGVTHNLELDLFVTFYGFLYENLMYRRKLECVKTKLYKLFLVVCKTAACTAECECRTKNYRITDTFCSLFRLVDGVCDLRRDNRLTNGLAEFFEQLSILCTLDGCAGCTEKFYTALTKDALLLKLHSQV